ncbi:MAG: flotillin-like FloA family protein [Vulcanimicrobiota bacterium]
MILSIYFFRTARYYRAGNSFNDLCGIFCFRIPVFFFPLQLYISAISAGTPISANSLIQMRLKKIDPYKLVPLYIKARKAGVNLNLKQLEEYYLNGRDVNQIVNALIIADKAGIFLSLEEAVQMDRDGQDVVREVRNRIEPNSPSL